MKNNLLLVLLFSGLFSPLAFAQKRLSPGLRPYTENPSNALVKSLHRAGFDLPATTPADNKPAANRNALQLDSTRTFNAYGLNGSGDSTPVLRSTYQYPQPGVKVEFNAQYENNQWQMLDRITLTSDDQQRLVEVLAEAFDAETQSFQPDSRIKIYPHEDSPELIDSAFTYLWDSTLMDWHIILSNRYVFDAEDKVLETYTSLDYFGDPVIFKEVYTYDANGDNNRIEEFAILGNEVVPSSQTEIMYADHKPIEVLVLESDGLSFFPKNRTNYAYTLFGAVRKQMNFEWDDSEGKWYLFQTIEYAYDNEQRLGSKETALLPKGLPESHEIVIFAYVEGENLSQEWVLIWNDDLFDWVLDSKKFYYYEGLVAVNPGPVSTQSLEILPNPTAGITRLHLEGPARIQVYDASGALVSNEEYHPENLLNLTHLPNGLYFVTAQSETAVYTGSVVKQ